MKTQDELQKDIQMVVAGHSVTTVLGEQMISMAATIGFASSDLAAADDLVDTIAEDLKRSIRENWDYLQQTRLASAGGAVGAA